MTGNGKALIQIAAGEMPVADFRVNPGSPTGHIRTTFVPDGTIGETARGRGRKMEDGAKRKAEMQQTDDHAAMRLASRGAPPKEKADHGIAGPRIGEMARRQGGEDENEDEEEGPFGTKFNCLEGQRL